MNEQNLTRLRELLVNEFSEEELATLCQDIGLNYAELPGMGIHGKTREIIAAVQARHITPALSARVRDLRPDAYKAAKIVDMEAEPATPGAVATAPAVTNTTAAAATLLDPPRAVLEPPSSSSMPMASALSPRVRLIAMITAVVLLVIAALTLALPKPGAAPGVTPAALPTATAAVAAAVTPTVQAEAPVTPAVAPAITETQQATEAAPPAEVTTTASISESHPAAQAVRAINDQLVNFYLGKETTEAIRPYWGDGPYKVVLDFATKILKKQLSVDIAKSDELKVTLRYVRAPALVAENGDTLQVTSREYWGYTNTRTNRSICDTRDYTYTLVKNGDQYQVRGLTSRLVNTRCQE